MPSVKIDYTPRDILDPFVGTGNYNPQTNVITLYVDSRQLKDILRTFCHELVHHSQYLSDPEGFLSLDKSGSLDDNPALEQIEADAYARGNVLFRKWTETRR